MPEKNKIISIEEHFWTANLRDRYTGYARVAPHHPTKQLDVPIYLHPAIPHPAVMEAYYNDYKPKGFPTGAVLWGFMAEMGLQAIRLMQSGVFEKYPKLKFILGHLGESIPFMLWRCDWLFRKGFD